MNDHERLWHNVAVSSVDDCWPWMRYRDRNGYGQMGRSNPRRLVYAHRFAWEVTNGPIPSGMEVCHACDNPPCCNPAHLFVGSPSDNMQDASIKGRISRGEAHHWAKLTEADVIEMRSLAGSVSWSNLRRRYGISKMTVYNVLHRKTWRHI